MKRIPWLLTLVAGLAAVACGASTAAPVLQPARDSAKTSIGTTAATAGSVSGAGGAANLAPAEATTQAPPATVVPNGEGPQVIRTAQISLSVGQDSFDSRMSDLRALVEREGGYIAGTDAQVAPDAAGKIRTGVISFMVPSAKFDEAIDSLSKLGKVQTEHISGNDVSAQYVDLQARLKNAEAQRDAMLALLGQAKAINDIITVQNQIGQITGQIEQLKGQIQYIDHNTSFSNISVTIAESGATAVQSPKDSWGFVTALGDAAHNFVNSVNWVVTGLGAVAPFLIVLGLAYILFGRRVILRLRQA